MTPKSRTLLTALALLTSLTACHPTAPSARPSPTHAPPDQATDADRPAAHHAPPQEAPAPKSPAQAGPGQAGRSHTTPAHPTPASTASARASGPSAASGQAGGPSDASAQAGGPSDASAQAGGASVASARASRVSVASGQVGRASADPAPAGHASAHPAQAGRASAAFTQAARASAASARAAWAAAAPVQVGRVSAEFAQAGRVSAASAQAGRASADPAQAGRTSAVPTRAGRVSVTSAQAGRGSAASAQAGRGSADLAQAGRASAAPAQAGRVSAAPAPAGRGSVSVWGVPGCVASVPYVSGEGGYAIYRIPAVVETPHGTVLAFAEGRRDGAADTGDIDVVLRRSADGGCTWGPLTVVAAGHGDTRGNPAPVVDPRTGAVVLVTCGNDGKATEDQIRRGAVDRRVFVQRSRDDGRHFTPPAEITAQVKRPGWRWYATGPGHALALTRGPHAGRLLVPANHSVAPPATSAGPGSRYDGGHAFYSDDGGRTWQLGFVTGTQDGVTNVNETTAAQLPDSRLYFNARDQYGTAPGNRLDTYSADGGTTLDRPYTVQPTLNAVPVVQGSVLQLRGPAAPLLFSAPSVPSARRALALWSSTDAGRTFTKLLTLSDRPAAYSDLVQLGPGTIGVLYETGATHSYDTVEFRRLTLSRG